MVVAPQTVGFLTNLDGAFAIARMLPQQLVTCLPRRGVERLLHCLVSSLFVRRLERVLLHVHAHVDAARAGGALETSMLTPSCPSRSRSRQARPPFTMCWPRWLSPFGPRG